MGRPTTKAAIAITHTPSGRTSVYASWNGATEIARWQVLGGPDASHLVPLATAAKTGFETAIPLPTSPSYLTVRAVSSSGAALGSSPIRKN